MSLTAVVAFLAIQLPYVALSVKVNTRTAGLSSLKVSAAPSSHWTVANGTAACVFDTETNSKADSNGHLKGLAIACCKGDDTSESEGSRDNCQGAKPFSEAEAHCKKFEKRLCTKAELEAGRHLNKGCDFDELFHWTSDKCTMEGWVEPDPPEHEQTVVLAAHKCGEEIKVPVPDDVVRVDALLVGGDGGAGWFDDRDKNKSVGAGYGGTATGKMVVQSGDQMWMTAGCQGMSTRWRSTGPGGGGSSAVSLSTGDAWGKKIEKYNESYLALLGATKCENPTVTDRDIVQDKAGKEMTIAALKALELEKLKALFPLKLRLDKDAWGKKIEKYNESYLALLGATKCENPTVTDRDIVQDKAGKEMTIAALKALELEKLKALFPLKLRLDKVFMIAGGGGGSSGCSIGGGHGGAGGAKTAGNSSGESFATGGNDTVGGEGANASKGEIDGKEGGADGDGGNVDGCKGGKGGAGHRLGGCGGQKVDYCGGGGGGAGYRGGGAGASGAQGSGGGGGSGYFSGSVLQGKVEKLGRDGKEYGTAEPRNGQVVLTFKVALSAEAAKEHHAACGTKKEIKIPEGTTQIQAVLLGGDGGLAQISPGDVAKDVGPGKGGRVKGVFSVSKDDKLYVIEGCKGRSTYIQSLGGGGGGSTAILKGDTVIMLAGGGGGAGGCSFDGGHGGPGGSTPSENNPKIAAGGAGGGAEKTKATGGSAAAGGTGAKSLGNEPQGGVGFANGNGGHVPATQGFFGGSGGDGYTKGGNGGQRNGQCGGGGGGAGKTGGGGGTNGAKGAGGGGGSSFAHASVKDLDFKREGPFFGKYTPQDGSVELTFFQVHKDAADGWALKDPAVSTVAETKHWAIMGAKEAGETESSLSQVSPEESAADAKDVSQRKLVDWGAKKEKECLPDSSVVSKKANKFGTALGVTCCDNDGKATRPGCAAAKTFLEAEAICKKENLKLCSRETLESGASEGTGCGFDGLLNWSSDKCS
eukprot:TRINITY_DN2214_c1_g1_i2.p1 TRINITY_DN2214_c1_g1~~TRINITY_DN2214_c1_g1_i2.p1  ORF type:complete len:981 (+),score=258.37 TRINITY_DN2214_c1_g1_i2:45-2987(+)